MIFAHSIIPHNHHEVKSSCYRYSVHSISSDVCPMDTIVRFESKPLAEKVCHLTGFEYFQINTDNIIIFPDKTFIKDKCNTQIKQLIQWSISFISDPHLGKPDLRAPPLS